MSDTTQTPPSPPKVVTEENESGTIITLIGDWNIRSLAASPKADRNIERFAGRDDVAWQLDVIGGFDSAGAWIVWQGWGKRLPLKVTMRPEQRKLFERWSGFEPGLREPKHEGFASPFPYVWQLLRHFVEHLLNWLEMLGQLILDFLFLMAHPSAMPWAEISVTIYEAGVRALGITALVGFLIGIVLSYLSALQLQAFGAEIYIIDILGLSIIRELGPLLAAILVAGRSGSSMTAQIGIMRVTEELDALSAMGISHSLRLILPKVVALMLTLPLITLWTDFAALLGGMLSAQHTLDISAQQFYVRLPDAVPLANLVIGVGKAAVFGVLVALIGCHFGFLIKPNTESLGSETTNSVVASITAVIMADAVFAILFMHVGMP
ncbi:MAG: MlaE family ABC transporter permease [Gammaproteobacteria bacterium]